MVSVRTVTVGNAEYLQVVEYRQVKGQTKVDVIKSFGRSTLENQLKAEQFAAEYERLRNIAKEYVKQGKEKDDFWTFALAVFGIILGGIIVTAILNEIFGEKET